MDGGIWSGMTRLDMKETGRIIRPAGWVSSSTQTGPNTKVNGPTTSRTAKGCTKPWEEPATKGSGRTTSNMVRASRSGLMAPRLKASTSLATKAVMAHTSGLTSRYIKDIGSTIRSMATGSTNGQMGASISASGAITTWKVTESTYMRMGFDMMVSLGQIKRKDTGFIIGQTGAGMKDGGHTASSMAWEYTGIISSKRSLACGKAENASNGLIRSN